LRDQADVTPYFGEALADRREPPSFSRVSRAAALRKLLQAADPIAGRRRFRASLSSAVACGVADDRYHGQGSRDVS
jgi:hypothetical protein